MNRQSAPCKWPMDPLFKVSRADNVWQLMKQLRVSGVTAKHAIDYGLTDRQADTWAIRLGYHPIEIWPTYCDQKDPA